MKHKDKIEFFKNLQSQSVPLAVRMRPNNLDQFFGQKHLLKDELPLVRLINGEGFASVILYGPPGSGKTTLAEIISKVEDREFIALSALTSGVKDIRYVVDRAKQNLLYDKQTILFIDEVHRFSKNQQDALLSAVENRIVLLVAATTENPAFSIISPLISRSLLLQLKELSAEDLRDLIERAVKSEVGLNSLVELNNDSLNSIIRLSAGDARKALTILEEVSLTELTKESKKKNIKFPVKIYEENVSENVDKAFINYDKDGDQHYDVISAFIKSVRGSDVDAALHYLARMISSGEDLRFIARRLMILASEDIGLAEPNALLQAEAAFNAVQLVGLPEGRIPLAQATIFLSLAPKSNAVYLAIDKAISDVEKGNIGPVPTHLRDSHYKLAKDLGNSINYIYPHNFDTGIIEQQYAPDVIKDKKYYFPNIRGQEINFSKRLDKIRHILKRKK